MEGPIPGGGLRRLPGDFHRGHNSLSLGRHGHPVLSIADIDAGSLGVRYLPSGVFLVLAMGSCLGIECGAPRPRREWFVSLSNGVVL
jgi:hypothetical protein